MSKINNGGPAFPQSFAMSPKPDHGMNLRDYFAAKAMQGLCTAYGDGDSWPDSDVPEHYECVAFHAYAMADAMLAAREKDGSS